MCKMTRFDELPSSGRCCMDLPAGDDLMSARAAIGLLLFAFTVALAWWVLG